MFDCRRGGWSADHLLERTSYLPSTALGELSLFFINALAVVVLFDRGAEIDVVLWKVFILVAILFAICTYKYQLGKLGDSLIEGQPDVAGRV